MYMIPHSLPYSVSGRRALPNLNFSFVVFQALSRCHEICILHIYMRGINFAISLALVIIIIFFAFPPPLFLRPSLPLYSLASYNALAKRCTIDICTTKLAINMQQMT